MTQQPNDVLERLLEQAVNGERDILKDFFRHLLESQLYVPDRAQDLPLSHAPTYPNDFVSLLGIQDAERVVAPAFSRPELIEEWFGSPLRYSELSGTTLLHRIPTEWWLVLNTGTQFSKELSPWELDRLRAAHPEDIDALVEENNRSQEPETLDLRPIESEEYGDAKAAMSAFAKTTATIVKLYLMQERELSDEGEVQDRPLLVMLTTSLSASESEKLMDTIKQLVSPYFIGSDFRVRIGGPEDALVAGMMTAYEPFYKRPNSSPLQNFKRWCRSLVKQRS